MLPRGRNADKHALEPDSPCSVDGEPTVAVRSRPAAPHLVLRDVLRMGPTGRCWPAAHSFNEAMQPRREVEQARGSRNGGGTGQGNAELRDDARK
jgi:hypothetical protein